MLKIMIKKFPKDFLFGTSTSACQIETTKGTNWHGLKTRDNHVVDRNIEHDLRRMEDAEIIATLGNAYRFNPDWAKLQKRPFAQLDPKAVEDYRKFMGFLKDKGLYLMLTLHHFANPDWFESAGSWKSDEAPEVFADYSRMMAREFGDLTNSWNTINEPTTHTFNGYLLGFFPPNKKSLPLAIQVLKQQKRAHQRVYNAIKDILPEQEVGISNATMDFHPESFFGNLTATIAKKVYLQIVPDMFKETDFVGVSYYGKIPFTPLPVTEIENPGKLSSMNREHDKMWEYYPQGLEDIIAYFHRRYNKPIIVTENGCCTDDDSFRMRSINDHLSAIHDSMANADVRGYFHWSTFDNVELHLGPSMRFGLVNVDYQTMERKIKPSGKFYSATAKTGVLNIN